MVRSEKQRLSIIVVLIASAGAGALGYALAEPAFPKRFAEVVPGQLYRSGAATPGQIERVARDFGVRRVICLLNPEDPDAADEIAAERDKVLELGMEWINIPMRGNGASTPAARAELTAALLDPNAAPTLVHCAAGVNRTGLAVGLYRILAQDWTYPEVLDELRRRDFDDLPKHENMRAALQAAAAAHHAAAPAP